MLTKTTSRESSPVVEVDEPDNLRDRSVGGSIVQAASTVPSGWRSIRRSRRRSSPTCTPHRSAERARVRVRGIDGRHEGVLGPGPEGPSDPARRVDVERGDRVDQCGCTDRGGCRVGRAHIVELARRVVDDRDLLPRRPASRRMPVRPPSVWRVQLRQLPRRFRYGACVDSPEIFSAKVSPP